MTRTSWANRRQDHHRLPLGGPSLVPIIRGPSGLTDLSSSLRPDSPPPGHRDGHIDCALLDFSDVRRRPLPDRPAYNPGQRAGLGERINGFAASSAQLLAQLRCRAYSSFITSRLTP